MCTYLRRNADCPIVTPAIWLTEFKSILPYLHVLFSIGMVPITWW